MVTTPSRRLSRRRVLQAVGVSSIGFVAGCLGDDDSNDEPDNSSSEIDGSEVVDQTFVLNSSTDFTQVNFNLFNPTNTPGEDLAQALWDPLAYLRAVPLDYKPLVCDEWSFEDNTITLSLNNEYSWHDGQSVTADDIVVQLRLGEIVGSTLWDYAEGVEATADDTVSIDVESVNPDTIWPGLLPDTIHAKEDTDSQFIEDWEDATSDDERDSIREDLLTFTVDEAPAGTGPFEITNHTSDRIVMERYDDYPFAENVNFSEFEFLSYPDEGRADEALLGGELDGVAHSPSETARTQAADRYEWATYPAHSGHAISFSPQSNTFGVGHRLERQAVAYLINEESFKQLMDPFARETPLLTCSLTNPQIEEYLSDVMDDFNQYQSPQPDKAEELLEEAGYERNDGTWVDEDGEPIEAPLAFPAAWSSGVPSWENLVEQFNDFGFESTVQGEEDSTLFGDILPNHDFELVSGPQYYGIHPFQNFRGSLGSFTDPLGPYTNELEELDVPMPIGDPDGEIETVNVQEKILELGQTTDDETERELIHELAWVFNQWVPFHHLTENGFPTCINTDDWMWAGPDDPDVQNGALPYTAKAGKLGARTE